VPPARTRTYEPLARALRRALPRRANARLRPRRCEFRDVDAEERTCEPSTRTVHPWDPARGTWMEPPPGSTAAPCDEGEYDGE